MTCNDKKENLLRLTTCNFTSITGMKVNFHAEFHSCVIMNLDNNLSINLTYFHYTNLLLHNKQYNRVLQDTRYTFYKHYTSKMVSLRSSIKFFRS